MSSSSLLAVSSLKETLISSTTITTTHQKAKSASKKAYKNRQKRSSATEKTVTTSSSSPSFSSSLSSSTSSSSSSSSSLSSLSSLSSVTSTIKGESDEVSSLRNQQKNQRPRQYHKRTSAQPKLQRTSTSTSTLPAGLKRRRRSNSAVIYAGAHFMNDAPSPSSLPLPTEVIAPVAAPVHSISLHPFYQHRPTLYERSLVIDSCKSSSSYLMDPISEIQEKLRTMLKIQA